MFSFAIKAIIKLFPVSPAVALMGDQLKGGSNWDSILIGLDDYIRIFSK